MSETVGTVLSATKQQPEDRGWGGGRGERGSEGRERTCGREGGGGARGGVAGEGLGSIPFMEQIRFVKGFSLAQEFSFLCISKYYKILSYGRQRMCFYEIQDFIYKKRHAKYLVSNFSR